MENRLFARQLAPRILAALRDNPVVLLNGARQVGKSTLAQMLLEQGHKAQYLTLDDPTTLTALHEDPRAVLEAIEGNIIIDEVQRAPEVFRAIKGIIDKHRTPGRFLLTGSANVLRAHMLSESLTGRMEILTLYPFSQSEIENSSGNLVDSLFQSRFPANLKLAPETPEGLRRRMLRGGYPEPVHRKDQGRRQAWFRSYLTTILQRDIRELANIEGLSMMPRLLASLASRSGSLLNYAAIAAESGIPQSTLKRYLSLFEASYLVGTAPAWSVNIGKRLVKSPKLYMLDIGLALAVLGADANRLVRDPEMSGRMFETFIFTELLKLVSWSENTPRLFHFRTHVGDEVDFILERDDGRIVAIEAKSGTSIRSETLKTMTLLKQDQKKRFHRGVVLYGGKEIMPLGRDLFAVPVSALWSKEG